MPEPTETTVETPAAAPEVHYIEAPAPKSPGAEFLASRAAEAAKATETPPADPPAAEAKVDEPAKEEAPKEDGPPKPPLSKEFAALARKTKELKAREEALASKEKEVGSAAELREKLKTGGLKAYQDLLGKTDEEIYREIVNRDEPAPEPTEADRVSALEKKLLDKEAADQQRHVDAVKAQVFDAIRAETDRFELINADGAHERVWKLISDYHEQWGEPLDPAIAADTIEQKILDESTAKLERLAKTKKLSARFAGSAGQQTQQAPTEGASRQPPQTLNSSNTQRPVPASDEDTWPADRDERLAEFKRRRGYAA